MSYGRKVFVDVRQTEEGHRFDLYFEAKPEELLPNRMNLKDQELKRVTIDRDLTYERFGIALASATPDGGAVVVEIRKVRDVDDYDDSNCC